MVKHIVLFKLRDDVPVEEKLVVMNSFKEAIEALPAKNLCDPQNWSRIEYESGRNLEYCVV